MATVLRMPGVSADATEAALLAWTVHPGAQVKRGDVIVSVETEKAVVELEAEEDAVLLKTFASAGELVPIGDPIAVFIQPGEETKGEAAILAELGLGPRSSGSRSPADEDRSQDSLVLGLTPEIAHTADQVVVAHSGGNSRVFASPLARRMAAEAGLPLEGLHGSGPGGRIRRRDIDQAVGRRGASGTIAAESEELETPPVAFSRAPGPVRDAVQSPTVASGRFTDIPHTKFRRAVASALTASKQQVPHFYLKATCRVDQLLELRGQVNADSGVKITINDFIVKAAGRAMIDVPDMNVIWTADAVRRFESVDIAVAMSSERGLMTPVVRSVHQRSLSDLSATIKDLGARANAGRLKQHELEGGSLTVSNLGMFGTVEFAAIINPPQAGILAVGAVTSQPVEVEGGGVSFAKFITVILSADHRPVDGALAAQWLQHFKALIESPLRLLL